MLKLFTFVYINFLRKYKFKSQLVSTNIFQRHYLKN